MQYRLLQKFLFLKKKKLSRWFRSSVINDKLYISLQPNSDMLTSKSKQTFHKCE